MNWQFRAAAAFFSNAAATPVIGDSLQSRESVGAVALAVLVDAIHVQDTQQEIASSDGLSVVVQVAPAFQLPIGPPDEKVHDILLIMVETIPVPVFVAVIETPGSKAPVASEMLPPNVALLVCADI